MRRRILLAGLAAFPLAAAAAGTKSNSYVDRHFTIELPPGYIGPVEHISGTSVSRGFRKPLPSTPLSTVILVSVQEMGASFAKRVPDERARLTRETLEPIMEGIGSNRVGFREDPPTEVKIAGYPGLKTAWSGAAQGIAFEGIVYCVLAGSRAIAIQIQDPAGSGKERMAEAVRAVERMGIVP
jgi:hypothetical protein